MPERPVIDSCPIDRLTIDPGLQARVVVREGQICAYAEAKRAGDKFPPVVAFLEPQDDADDVLWLADGFIRVAADRLNGTTEIEVEVRPGTRLDALHYAVQANDRHGFRRTTDDKENAVLILLGTGEYDRVAVAEIVRRTRTSEHIVRNAFAKHYGPDWREKRGEKVVGGNRVEQSASADCQPLNLEVDNPPTPNRVIGGDGKSRPARTSSEAEIRERRQQVKALHASGKTTSQIEKTLGLSHGTVVADLKQPDDEPAVQQAPAPEQQPPRKRRGCSAPVEEQALDGRGQPIPSHLRDAFGANVLKELLEAFHKYLKGVEESRSWAVFLKQEGIETLREAECVLEAAIPFAVCTCGGQGCGRCRTAGWIPRWVVEDFELAGGEWPDKPHNGKAEPAA